MSTSVPSRHSPFYPLASGSREPSRPHSQNLQRPDEIRRVHFREPRDVMELEAQAPHPRSVRRNLMVATEEEPQPKPGYWAKHAPETIGILGGVALLAYFGGYIGHAIESVKSFLAHHNPANG